MVKEAKKEASAPKYSFYLGCIIPNRYPMVEQATRNVFSKLGVDLVDMKGATCCPAPGVFRSFDIPTWMTLGARNLTIAEDNKANVMTMCNGCYGTLLEVNHALKESPTKKEEINAHLKKVNREFKGSVKVEHLMEVLYYDLGMEKVREFITKKLGLKVAVHYGCHLLKPVENRPWQGESENPRFFDDIIEMLGCESVNYQDKLMCCGAGGGVRSAIKEVSLDFTRQKLENIRKAGADCIVVACPFCELQLDLGQFEVNNMFKDQIGQPFGIPVFYVTQLLGLAMGMNPVDLGLIKRNDLKGVPPYISQEKLLIELLGRLGYDYNKLKSTVEAKV
jgi:heterodisulfide reductase subunit B